MYRRDRLYTSDKDRLVNLQECLRNVRITDESAFFNSVPEGPSSPTKIGKGNRDGMPPKGPGGKGGGGPGNDKGPGGGGSAAGGTGYGSYSGPGNKSLAGSSATDKGGSNFKGASDYSSAARNPHKKAVNLGGVERD